MRAPLRYYGGKSRALDQIYDFFPTSFSKKVMVDVFGGSWIVTLNAPKIKRAIVNDYYGDLQNFWWVVRGWPIEKKGDEYKAFETIMADPKAFYPLFELFKVEHDSMVYNVDYIQKLTEEIELLESLDENDNMIAVVKAAKFYLVNRIKYSGMQNCKDTSGFHSLPGGNVFHETLQEWHNWFKNKDVRVWNLDFREVMKKVNKMDPKTLELFIYCDPPYVDEGGGYKHSFVEQDHRDLAKLLLESKHKWVLSYDDDKAGLVRELYEGKEGIEITPVRWEYSSTKGNATNGKHELIITNNSVDVNEI